MTQAGEIRALARLKMVSENELINKAQLVQPGLASLDDMGFQTYHFLMGVLLAKQNNDEHLPFEPDEEEEEEEEDTRTEEEKYLDGLWAEREDTAESLAIERAIENGWW